VGGSSTLIDRFGRSRRRVSAVIGLLAGILCACGAAHAQGPNQPRLAGPSQAEGQPDAQQAGSPDSSLPPATAPSPTAIPDVTKVNAAGTCVQPAPLLTWQDYKGPYAKLVGGIGRKVERKSVHPPEYKSGKLLCTFTVRSKVRLALEDMVDPFTILNIAFNAGISQAENNDPTFGQGAEGYGKRFAASAADQASGDFFKFIVYPTIFSEDPRYYRLAEGSTRQRLVHALGHVVIAHKEDGSHMFNFSEWLGTTSTVVLSNTYHPGNRRGVGPAAESIALNMATDSGFDILREFWPEIAHKFRLPFRDQNEPGS
jgi:hypothetical protein